ncbi:MAG: adenosylcobinamide-GDP ribazoletransferase [Desulfuromusa sp.]|nr:adenosylcobinamide-GDP ribazoletransferase [Desulfuromusa sp.]
MRSESFFSAVRFLTIVPVPESWCGDESAFHKSPEWYPLVGLLIGLVMVAADLIFRWLLPVPVASVLLLLVMIAVSGALHLDGLADSADAFFSSRGREKMLEIMKDSRSGPMGVTALVLVLLLKLMLLISLPDAWRWQVILLIPFVGRCSIVVVSSWLPYARQEGTAAFTANNFSWSRFGIVLGMLFVVTLSLLGGAGLAVVAIFSLSLWLLGHYSLRKIGGFTGDTLGATCELMELLPPLCVIILAQQGLLS